MAPRLSVAPEYILTISSFENSQNVKMSSLIVEILLLSFLGIFLD
jgi:hypothetical protein